MPYCFYCDKEIHPRDEDAGTAKELFCDEKCEAEHEKIIDGMNKEDEEEN